MLPATASSLIFYLQNLVFFVEFSPLSQVLFGVAHRTYKHLKDDKQREKELITRLLYLWSWN